LREDPLVTGLPFDVLRLGGGSGRTPSLSPVGCDTCTCVMRIVILEEIYTCRQAGTEPAASKDKYIQIVWRPPIMRENRDSIRRNLVFARRLKWLYNAC
jgi:hypothetical protein